MSDKHRFVSKYSKAIEAHGFITIPTLLLMKIELLGITSSELVTYMALESYRWDGRKPYPSVQAMSKRSNQSQSTIRSNLRGMEKKNLIKRNIRIGTTSKYDVTPLVNRLDQIAISHKPTNKTLPPSIADTRPIPSRISDTKEDSFKKTQEKEENNNKGLQSLAKILEQKTVQEFKQMVDKDEL